MCTYSSFYQFFLDVLLQKRSENLAVSSGEQTDALNTENKSTLVKGNNVSAHQAPANNANLVYMEEFDASIAILNIVSSMHLLGRNQLFEKYFIIDLIVII